MGSKRDCFIPKVAENVVREMFGRERRGVPRLQHWLKLGTRQSESSFPRSTAG